MRNAHKPPHCVNAANHRSPTTALIVRCSLVLSAAGVGVLGTLQDSKNGGHLFVGGDAHLLFGSLLWLAVLAQFWSTQHLHVEQIAAHSRGVSRWVCVLLYGLTGVRALCFRWQNGPGNDLTLTMAESMRTLQSDVVYGLLALIMIRVFSACEMQSRIGDISRGNRPRA